MPSLRASANAIRHFFPKVEEWMLGAVPSSLSYQGLFSHYEIQGTVLILCIAGLAVAFAFTLSANRVHKRRKALSEILATGYHVNFVEHLEGSMRTQGTVAVNGVAYDITDVRITLPRNVQEMRAHMASVKAALIKRALIDVPYGGRTVMVEPRGTGAVIRDFPRTLGSFSDYLTNEGDMGADGEVPKRYYKWFAAHLVALKRRRLGRYDRFQFVDVNDVVIC